MMKLLLTVFFIFSSLLIRAQDCSCAGQLSSVISYFEQNSPAFQKIKEKLKSYKNYQAGVNKLRSAVIAEKDTDRCIICLDRYVALLKDHHSSIGFDLKRTTDLGSPEKIAAFKQSAGYRAFKKILIDSSKLVDGLRLKKNNELEGIYSDGRNTVFGIIKDRSPNKYLGVVLKTNKLLEQGHVLFEFVQNADRSYTVTYNIGLLGFNFQKIFKSLFIENGQLPDFGFAKTSSVKTEEKPYSFKPLDAAANYLRLHSFDGRLTHELDSFYLTIDSAIKSKPFLIIDIRGNGGGSEGSYLNLLPYAYTRPLKIDSAIIWVSPDNIKRYEESSRDTGNTLIKRMKEAKPYSFIPLSEAGMNTWALDSGTVFPQKIALLYDKGAASAAEGMILYFMQSDKVITIGENSGGYMGYGNVMTAKTPCGKYTIQCTTTRYFEKSKYEFTGITPMHRVSKKTDWINYARALLK